MKLTTVFNENVHQMVLKEEIKARKHPGKCYVIPKPLPDDLVDSILKCLKGFKNQYIFVNYFEYLLIKYYCRCTGKRCAE